MAPVAENCPSYSRCRVSSVVFSDKVRGVHVCWLHPFVVTIRETLPLDQILQFLRSPNAAMAKDPFYLLFFFSIHNVGWRSGVIRPMCRGLMVWGEKGCVERVVDPPGGRESQLVDDWRDHPSDDEGSVSLGVYLGGLMW